MLHRIGMFSTYNKNILKFESTPLKVVVAGTPSRDPLSVPLVVGSWDGCGLELIVVRVSVRTSFSDFVE